MPIFGKGHLPPPPTLVHNSEPRGVGGFSGGIEQNQQDKYRAYNCGNKSGK